MILDRRFLAESGTSGLAARMLFPTSASETLNPQNKDPLLFGLGGIDPQPREKAQLLDICRPCICDRLTSAQAPLDLHNIGRNLCGG
jgi:hypothetical protein